MALQTSRFISHVKDYEAACLKATKQVFAMAAKVIAGRARQLAPRSMTHRSNRTYPGGRKYTGEKRISQSIRYKVKADRRRGAASVYAMVKVAVGYGVFLEYGTKTMKSAKGALSFTRRALEEKKEIVMQMLKTGWPK